MDNVVGAQLGAVGFESFVESETGVVAYIQKEEAFPGKTDELDYDSLLEDVDIMTSDLFEVSYTAKEIEQVNWNEEWEKHFDPIEVDGRCAVRAPFHEKTEVEFDIVIEPKMSFGTGHHETTYMMMATMRDLDIKTKTIFDYGCGTGILAVLASKMDCSTIDAIDIEEESYENTLENANLNKVDNIAVTCSDLEHFEAKTYDIILANINRNVLLNSAKELYDRLNQDGTLLISGILDVDETLVSGKYKSVGFKINKVNARGYWRCIGLHK